MGPISVVPCQIMIPREGRSHIQVQKHATGMVRKGVGEGSKAPCGNLQSACVHGEGGGKVLKKTRLTREGSSSQNRAEVNKKKRKEVCEMERLGNLGGTLIADPFLVDLQREIV